jgi:drug/metabolite transporter (DMT)-like permease
VRQTVLSKLVPLLIYAIASVICFGSAFVCAALLYNEVAVTNALVYLFLAITGTAGSFYLYFRVLSLLSPKRRTYSYPAAHRPKL